MRDNNVVDQFRSAIVAAGIEPPKDIVADGRLHRFPTNGDRRDTAGWYKLHLDGIPAGAFGCWRTNTNQTWCAGSETTMTAEQRAEYEEFCHSTERERDAEQQKLWNEAAQEAKQLWAAAKEAPADHPYLVRKQVKSYGLRCDGERLLVGVRDKDRGLRSLQFIDEEGGKLFLPGGHVGGGYFAIGDAPKDVLYVAEGYATGATIHEATGAPVTVAFNAGNLLPVAKTLREKFPDIEIIICADDDYRTASNPGVMKANEAATRIGAKVVVPEFRDRRPENATDFNDMAVHLGLDEVRECLQKTGAAPPAHEIEAPRPLMRELPPTDPFPVEALGEILGNAAAAIHDRVRAPLAICGQAVLATATLAVQGHADIVLPTGQKKPISNYYVTVAMTGERKSAVDTEAMAPIRTHESDLRELFDVDLASYINDETAWKIGRENIEKCGKGAKALSRAELKVKLDAFGQAPARPLEPTLTCDEPTIQGLERHFAVSRPSLGLFATEGGKFIAGHSMQDDNKIRTAASLSNLWDGEPIRRLRAAEGSMFMPGRRLAVHLAVEPEIADIMLADRELAAQGLLSRVLVTYPDSLIGTRMYRAEAKETAERLSAYADRIMEILDKPLPMAAAKLNELAPRLIEMEPSAKQMWLAFADSLEAQAGRGGSLASIAALVNKLPEHAARLSAVLSLVGNIEATTITAEQLELGIKLAQHYAAEALRTFTAGAINVDLMRAQDLLDWLHKSWNESAVCLTDIYQFGPTPIRESATAKRLVGILEAHGWLAKMKDGALIKGKKRREAWQIIKEEHHGLRKI